LSGNKNRTEQDILLKPALYYSRLRWELQLRFDFDSTGIRWAFDYQRSLRSQWHNTVAAVTVTFLFILQITYKNY